jgi:hypothetical protein
MDFIWNPITAANPLPYVIIVLLDIWSYGKKRNDMFLYIDEAFRIFSISHLMTLGGVDVILAAPLIVIRIPAYLLVAYAVYTAAK